MAAALENAPQTPNFPEPYTPVFSESEQTSAQRWHLVGGALASGGSCHSVPAPSVTALHLRYIAGEIALAQLLDETKRQLHHSEAPAADVRPLPAEQPGRAYPYAAEMARLLAELAEMPYQFYVNVTDEVPELESMVAGERSV